jgi:tRNA(fMet)-specific endonuclease VapC
MAIKKALLDTDTLSEILRARNSNVVAQAVAYKAIHNQLTISAITVMEIVKGMHKMGRTAALNRFLQGIQSSEVLPFDQPCAEIAGRIYGDLESAGQPIGRADVMIAAIALQHDLTLVTGNTRHYQYIQSVGYQLIIANWREEIAF